MKPHKPNAYTRIIECIFKKHYAPGKSVVVFPRSDISEIASALGVSVPKNLGDVVYSFRHRSALPNAIRAKAPKGREWIIRSAGPSRYAFELSSATVFAPSPNLVETKIPDATPGVIVSYALSDEQALLAKLRYNRLVDIFTALTCYSLQNHLRTAVPGIGQTETDELYIGLDRRGAHYVLPVQAKGGSDRLGVIQIENDFRMCGRKFPGLICRPIGAQFMDDSLIALFEFEQHGSEVGICSEKHYRLVRPEELSSDELRLYRERCAD